MKKLFFPIFFASIAVTGIAFGYAKLTEKNALICNQKYALCSAAQCIPDPTNPDNSICFCEVFQGKNFGYSSCDKRMPTSDQDGVEHVISTFSLENLETQKLMTCSSGNPWSNCLDQPCTVDPLDPKQAVCICKVIKMGEFVTFGGDCDASTCSTGFWSAATPESNAEAVKRMMHALGIKNSPERFCPKN